MTDWIADGVAAAALVISGYTIIDSRRRAASAANDAKRATEAAERSAGAAERSATASERSATAAEDMASGPPWLLAPLGDYRFELKNTLNHTAHRVTVVAISDVELTDAPTNVTMHAGGARSFWVMPITGPGDSYHVIEVRWQDTEGGEFRQWQTSVA
jgi:hypothetical protein